MRYGNKAFRLWHERLVQQGVRLCRSVLPDEKAGADIELEAYLLDSFGNATRIDYGTGHETTFMMLVCEFPLAHVWPCRMGTLLQHHRRSTRRRACDLSICRLPC
jgi:hypothetical protein